MQLEIVCTESTYKYLLYLLSLIGQVTDVSSNFTLCTQPSDQIHYKTLLENIYVW